MRPKSFQLYLKWYEWLNHDPIFQFHFEMQYQCSAYTTLQIPAGTTITIDWNRHTHPPSKVNSLDVSLLQEFFYQLDKFNLSFINKEGTQRFKRVRGWEAGNQAVGVHKVLHSILLNHRHIIEPQFSCELAFVLWARHQDICFIREDGTQQ